TTLLLDAVLNRLLVGLSNDAMAIDHHDGLWLANVPSVIGVRPDTVTLFAGPLRDLARHRVPTIGVADDGSHYYYPDRFLTARASARPMPGALPPVVAVGRFARPGEPARVRPIGPSRVCAMTIAELAAWPLGREVDGLAARLGGVSWRVVTARSIAVLDRLLTGATVVEFVHTGSVAPLLEFARSRQEETCR
ncbi:MAG TPA: hypothetical protein VH352_17135, partial [Pseudonocardiaceae bacterium]|nr:hypothetical protein [Pseudonocardiaceae bacterium]